MVNISIVTICYNNYLGVKKTVESVLSQSYSNIEYIIIDGDSNDGTKEYLEEIKRNDRVYVVSEPDRGIYDAMNKGLKLCNGDFVIFMNSSDTFANEEVIYNVAKKCHEKINFVYGDAFEYNPNSSELFYKKARSNKYIWYGMFAHHQSMLYSLKVIKDNALVFDINYQLSADWDFTIRFLKLVKGIKCVNIPICIFEQGGFSSNYIQGMNEQWHIRKKSLKLSFIARLLIYVYHFLINIMRDKLPWVYNFARFKKIK